MLAVVRVALYTKMVASSKVLALVLATMKASLLINLNAPFIKVPFQKTNSMAFQHYCQKTVLNSKANSNKANQTVSASCTQQAVNKFSGFFCNGVANRIGITEWANGDVYIGGISNFERNGYGVYLICATGVRYSGQWKNGEKHGQGCLVLSDGSKYEGTFSNDQMHGIGIYTDSDNNEWREKWDHGQIVSKVRFYSYDSLD